MPIVPEDKNTNELIKLIEDRNRVIQDLHNNISDFITIKEQEIRQAFSTSTKAIDQTMYLDLGTPFEERWQIIFKVCDELPNEATRRVEVFLKSKP